jgi:membrane dipeptidase
VSSLALAACSGDKKKPNEDVNAIHKQLLTIDTHVDISPDYTFKDMFDPGQKTSMQVDLEKMDQGGLDAAFFIVYVAQTERTIENYAIAKAQAQRKFDSIHRMTDSLYHEKIRLAEHPEDVIKLNDAGYKVAIIGIENGYVIGKDLSLVENYYNQGARYMTLAHNGHNDICDSAQPNKKLGDVAFEHNGVSDFGKQVISEMNRVGMMVDISHVSDECMMQSLTLSKAPVIASHSSVRALTDSPRNMTDEMMKALADANGVIQLVALSAYLKIDPERSVAKKALRKTIAEKYQAKKYNYELHSHKPEYIAGMKIIDKEYPLATVQDYVDHIDYAVKIMGVDHVGIASDFDGGGGIMGWKDASETMNVTKELLHRGYSVQDIEKIWGGNLLRVWQEVDNVARSYDNTM